MTLRVYVLSEVQQTYCVNHPGERATCAVQEGASPTVLFLCAVCRPIVKLTLLT